MIIYKNKVTHPTKSWQFVEDSKENILNDLENYTLDPKYEKYGNYLYKLTFRKEKQNKNSIYNRNNIYINVITDDENYINDLKTVISKNAKLNFGRL